MENQPYRQQWREQQSNTRVRLSFVGYFHLQMPLLAHYGFELVSSNFQKYFLSISLGHITDVGIKKAATDFLNRKDLRQKIRRELLFGLFPKTLTGK